MLFNRILTLASITCSGVFRTAKNRQNVSGGERLGHFGGPFWATPFPLARGSQNGPRPQGFASPRNNGAPLTAAGRSERTPHSKRERVRAESYQTAALLAPFSTAIDRQNDEGTRRGIVTEVLNRLNHVDVGVISELWDETADYVGVSGQLI